MQRYKEHRREIKKCKEALGKDGWYMMQESLVTASGTDIPICSTSRNPAFLQVKHVEEA